MLLFAWGSLVACSFAYLNNYNQTPGEIGSISAEASLPLRRPPAEKQWLLSMGIHPQCPCTRASLAELERLMVHLDRLVHTRVYVFKPSETDSSWLETPLMKKLYGVAGVEILLDQDGQIANQLGILTSGGVMLFDREGQLKFRGGLTSSRGHEGDSLGTQAIRELVYGRNPLQHHAPVYGCKIIAKREPLQ